MAEQLFYPSRLLALLRDLGKDVEENYKEHLREHDRVASGDLMRSIHTEVEVHGTTYEVVMNLADYWKYVEYDTKPHWPSKEPIDKWIFIKPVIPRPMNVKRVWWTNGRQRGKEKTIYNERTMQFIPSPQQLSYLIRRGISENGTKGSHDLRDAKAEVIPKFEDILLDALQRDTIEYIEKLVG